MSEMISIEITGDDKINHALAELLHKVQNLENPFNSVGSYLTNIIEESFDSETSPDGHAWHPLADSTKAYKEKHGENKILQSKDRNTRESTGYSADSDSMIVGVNAYSKDRYPYPIVHQFGTEDGKVPARPFMPITHDGELYDNVKVEVLDILLGYLGE
ncbi:phage virion morphogenesis protein [Sulfuricurvum sp.]|uniref:phage virion morphogenesis protein n=1 Tax=Sulfuricurvum sp. TaxID=2025608 RepID=UPI0026389140|nr:phage virion morphogenesis protein [Sulfuricurvum sp.]MDD2267030.1 phage virion morphogenesis protein [Sulfuricurvum sp.]MDD2782646.1 phage virion morphogenesis protein [Sulfuricurvum sp.]